MKICVLFLFSISLVLVSGCNRAGKQLITYPSDEYPTLQSAVDDLLPEGTLVIEPGIYREQITIEDKVIHIQGYTNQSIIDGQSATCITALNASGSTVENITMVNCNDGIFTDSFMTIQNNYFLNNTDGIDYEKGGGILSSNIFHMNKDDAIDLDLGVSVEIYNNTISGSLDDGIEIRLHPYNGDNLETKIKNNTFTNNQSNGIQFIDYEVETDRSFIIEGNTFIESGYNEISYSDNRSTLPTFNVGEISMSVIISDNIFYPSVYSFSGAGGLTLFSSNKIFSTNTEESINTNDTTTLNENVFIRLN